MRQRLLGMVLVGGAGIGSFGCHVDAALAAISWSSPIVIDGQPPVSHPSAFNDVSCPSPRLCVAAEARGVEVSSEPAGGRGAWVLTGFTGVSGHAGAGAVVAVSCPSD